MKHHIQSELIEHTKLVEEILFNHVGEIEAAASMLVQCYRHNGKVVCSAMEGQLPMRSI